MENGAMDSERWQNVERLHHATLECEESQRAAFLARACGGDEALRREVESLVSYGNRAGRFIEGSALEVVAPDMAGDEGDGHDPATDECRIIEKMIGKRISQYRVVEQLGRGGMGEVYRAVRADDLYQKQVAIKLVRAGEASGFVLGRFKNERQILASLDHPNIARLHDGGATDEGVPYFVMELVEGQPIDKYCDSHRLGIPARLQLFRQVCSALAYAHRHQIIHRDIKPSNILVTEEGVPKLLDFGIAKILDSSVLAGTVGATQTVFRAFTPEYASPEQIKAEPISTVSDVYSLGVLLYELLTGHRPYRFKTRTPLEIERAICEGEPLKPSTVVTQAEEQTLADGTTTSITPEEISRARNSDPKQMHSRLLGDLDAIVLTALRKEPHRRYASVDELSQDVRNHLEGLPIAARPSTIAYRGTKFVRRHKELAVGVLLFLVLVLLGGLAIVRRWEVSTPGPVPQRDVVRRQLTARAPGVQVNDAAISRDGKYLAYSDTAWKMYLLQIDTGELRQLPSSDFTPVDWFPDGNHLLVTGRGQHAGLWKVSIRDGASRKLLDSFCDENCAVSPDGSHIAYQRTPGSAEIWLMGADGEEPHRIAEFDAGDVVASPAWSPGEERLAYIRFRSEHDKQEAVIETCDLQGGHRTLVLSEPRLIGHTGPAVFWLPDGRILYPLQDPFPYTDSSFWSVATDPESGKPIGSPVRLANVAPDVDDFRTSADGKRFTYVSKARGDAVYIGNLQLGAKAFNPRRLTLDEWDSYPWDWARDSKAVLYNSRRSGRSAILKQRIEQQTPEILLSGAESYRWPVLSPTGDRLLYTAAATADWQHPSKRLMSMPVDGGASSVLLKREYYTYHCGSVPSARCVVSEVQGRQLVFSILDPVEGEGAEIQRVQVPPNSTDFLWSLSPDGNKIAIAYQLAGGEVRILTLADHKVLTLVLQGWKWDQMQSVAWSADGGHLFGTAWSETSTVLLFIDLRGNLEVLAEVPQGEAWLSYPVASPDGRYLAYMKRTFESNVMMLEHF
jgi:serine/threonine protein kinase/Tol biopolymer transport system component